MPTHPLRAPVPLWLLLVVGVVSAVVGVGLGQSGLLGDPRPQVTEGTASLLRGQDGLALFESEDVQLVFDSRSVNWTSGGASYDAADGAPVDCLNGREQVPLEMEYIETSEGTAVVRVNCP